MLVKIRHGEKFEPIWYRPEENKLEVGCKIYNSLGGWCIHTKSDIVLEIREDLDYEDFFEVESKEYELQYEDDFSFMYELINPMTIGRHYFDNTFISAGNPSQQLRRLVEDQLDNEYMPIGVCMTEEMDHNEGGVHYKPIVLSSYKDDERIYVHVNYDEWKKWADARTLQKSESVV